MTVSGSSNNPSGGLRSRKRLPSSNIPDEPEESVGRDSGSEVNRGRGSHEKFYDDRRSLPETDSLPDENLVDDDPFNEVEDLSSTRSSVSKLSSGKGQRRLPEQSHEFESEEDEILDDDSDDDDTFSDVDEDELYDDSDDEEEYYEEVVEEPEPTKPKKRASDFSFKKKKRYSGDSKKNHPPKRELEEQEDFIDEDELKLNPFGDKSKVKASMSRKVKVGNFDGRVNRQTQKTIVKNATLVILGLILVFTVWTAFKPDNSLSDEDITQIAQQAVGESGFPLQEGGGFAQNFMKSYLTLNQDDPGAEQILSYFYGGSVNDESNTSGSSSQINRSISGTYGQSIVYGPTIYSSRGIDENSANYVIGALVQPRFEAEIDPNTNKPLEEQPQPQWMFFNVNVFYDSESDSFAIVSDSPTVVPNLDSMSPSDVPDPESLGEEIKDDAILAQVDPTVKGFMKAYATSTHEDTSALEQYLSSNADPEARNGLGGQYEIVNADENPFEYTVHADPDLEGVLKIDLMVEWRSTATEKDAANYKSNYVLTLEQGSDGRYYVSKIAPKYYVKGKEE